LDSLDVLKVGELLMMIGLFFFDFALIVFLLCQANASAIANYLRDGFCMDCAPGLKNDGEKLEVDW